VCARLFRQKRHGRIEQMDLPGQEPLAEPTALLQKARWTINSIRCINRKPMQFQVLPLCKVRLLSPVERGLACNW